MCCGRAFAAILVANLLLATANAQTIPVERTFIPAWRSAGYGGLIPNRVGVSVKQFGAAGDGVADDTQAIRDAINWVAAKPGVGMVYFPAGVYRVTATLTLPDGITLRGERDATGNRATLRFDLGGANADCIVIAGTTSGALQSFAPQARHATWVEVQDATAFNVGDYARLWQANDPAWDNGDSWAHHAVGQMVQIVAIDYPANRLHLENALRADYLAQFSPQIQKVLPRQEVGLDNLTIERADTVTPTGGAIVFFNYAARCWVRGCELNRCFQRHFALFNSTKIQITGCYVHHAYEYGGGCAYGVDACYRSGECLIQDNIFQRLRHSMLVQCGANGNVFAYNYSLDAYRSEWPNNYASDIAFHGNRPYGNLFEGNIVCFIWYDASHGQSAGPYNTVYRNAATVQGLWFSQSDVSQQNLVGNDLLAGLLPYNVQGPNHFEWGNRVKSGSGYTVTPSGTSNLPDYSYYLAADPLQPVQPAFWTLAAPIPTIGCGSNLPYGQPNNPAKQRYAGSGPKTVGTSDPVILCEDFFLTLNAGWNLVSIPVEPIDPTPAAVFPAPQCAATWAYEAGTYVTPTTIQPKKGYWVWANSAGTLTITGARPANTAIALSPGWNLVGVVGPSAAQPAQPIPASPPVEAVWGYLPPYQVPVGVCHEGRGYWMHAAEATTIWSEP